MSVVATRRACLQGNQAASCHARQHVCSVSYHTRVHLFTSKLVSNAESGGASMMMDSGAASTVVRVSVAKASTLAVCAADPALAVRPPPLTTARSFAARRSESRLWFV